MGLKKSFLRTMYGSRSNDRRTAASRGEQRETYNIVQLQQRHHEILNKHLLGFKNVEIAQQLNITEVSVSGVIGSELGQAKLRDMREERDAGQFDVMKEIKVLAEDAVKVYKYILQEDQAGLALKKKTADTVLEMQGYGGKTVKLEGSISHLLTSSSDIQEAIARGLAAARSSGLVVDAEIIPDRSEEHGSGSGSGDIVPDNRYEAIGGGSGSGEIHYPTYGESIGVAAE